MSGVPPGGPPPTSSPQRPAPRHAYPWLVRLMVVALAAVGLAPAMVLTGSQPAQAGYAGLEEKSWSRVDGGNTYKLTARIAIETDGAGNGRFRFRMECFKNGAVHTCAMRFGSGYNAYWCNTQVPNTSSTPPAACASRELDARTGSNEVWVGSWHTLGHQEEWVYARGFYVVFNAGAGPTGTQHWIASNNAIVNLANQQAANGYAEWGSNCNYYSPGGPGAVCAEWCAMFATWVWDITGVPEVTSTVRQMYAARGLGQYGVQWGTFHRGSPKVGDWVIWGEPGFVTPGHVDILVGTYSDGSLSVVGGNVGDRVTKRRVYPGSTITNGQRISGYVTPSY